ncbi:hypothetical protein [Mordavella massiliensis]|uniref:Uncharacterized protein n=1 Tax=Mordavella massiliensis TaxID=1871024 RepID=A0A938XCB7_9CLOT|nr:hypothetical protein [Mordavella massiliensis]MBM6949184.1 hypothetical protein [Mordavella massiliensis]
MNKGRVPKIQGSEELFFSLKKLLLGKLVTSRGTNGIIDKILWEKMREEKREHEQIRD